MKQPEGVEARAVGPRWIAPFSAGQSAPPSYRKATCHLVLQDSRRLVDCDRPRLSCSVAQLSATMLLVLCPSVKFFVGLAGQFGLEGIVEPGEWSGN